MAGGSETAGREEARGGGADPTPPILIFSVNILVVQTFFLLCVMSIQSSLLPMQMKQQLLGVSSRVFHWGILHPRY